MPFIFNTPFVKVKKSSQKVLQRSKNFVTSCPFPSFFVLLGLLFAVIVLGSQLRKPPTQTVEEEKPVKEVAVYTYGGKPNITVAAKVEKSGIINIVAQSPGVVQKVKITEGKHVKRGSTLFNLSTNYQGGSIARVSTQIAAKNYIFNKETYDTQKEIIAKNREQAEKGSAQASELREITRKSIDETKTQITFQEELLKTIEDKIAELEAGPSTPGTEAEILGLKQAKAGILAALSGLRTGLRNTEYQSNEEQEPAQLATLQKDIALKQLDIQEKSLDLNKTISALNLKIAQISESLMNPASPVSGVVERVYISEGEVVNPGTLLATITANETDSSVVAQVSGDVARSISTIEPSVITIGEYEVSLTPRYISSEATNGTLFSVFYSLPENTEISASNEQIVTVVLPVGAGSFSDQTYIPLEAVYQTQSASYVYVVNKDTEPETVETKEIKLGAVYGKYVIVESGLESGDTVILDRTVVKGDKISMKESGV